MDRFDQAIKDVEERYTQLISSPRYKLNKLPKEMPEAGVYLFYERDCALFAGRSNNMTTRIRRQLYNSHYSATLAFLIARRETGKTKPTYTAANSRAALFTQPSFRSAFDRARERIREMEIQYVGEEDPVRQALLQVCASLKSKTEYNDFDNH